MKRLQKAGKIHVLLAMTIVLCAITACGAAPGNTQPAADAQMRSEAESVSEASEGRVTVTANSSVYAVPDIVSMDFGIQTQSSTAEGAQRANTDKTNAIIEALRGMEVERDDREDL